MFNDRGTPRASYGGIPTNTGIARTMAAFCPSDGRVHEKLKRINGCAASLVYVWESVHSLDTRTIHKAHVPDYNFGAHRHATCHSVSNLGSEDYIHDT